MMSRLPAVRLSQNGSIPGMVKTFGLSPKRPDWHYAICASPLSLRLEQCSREADHYFHLPARLRNSGATR